MFHDDLSRDVERFQVVAATGLDQHQRVALRDLAALAVRYHVLGVLQR